jgi:GNAT superfamily N-acetyltransferase
METSISKDGSDAKLERVSKQNRRNVREIYISAFPKEERMPFWLMLIMGRLWNTKFLALRDADAVCGFVYMAMTRRLIFIMFLAVDETIRSKGYGRRILTEVQSMHPGRKIIVSIERCDVEAHDIEQRIRRKRFYLSNGYAETGYLIKLAGVEQEILIADGAFSKREFRWLFIKYSNGTMYPKIWENCR